MRVFVFFNLFFQLFLASLSSNISAEESHKIQILTTIKPITMLVYAITKDKADIKQLIPDFTSVHDYHLTLLDLEKVDQANVIFRIDENMELLLNSAFELLPSSTPLVSLAKNENILLLPMAVEERSKKRNRKKPQNMDLHIWTSPQNALEIAKTITRTMVKVDPENSQEYENNLKAFQVNIRRTMLAIHQELLAVKKKEYVIFHNSWQYFQKSFSLKLPIIVAMQENILPSEKAIQEVRQKIKKIQPVCLFSDRHISESKIGEITKGFFINALDIDVLANRIYPVDEYSYANWLINMKNQVINCLEK